MPETEVIDIATEIVLATDKELPAHAAQSIHEGFSALYLQADQWRAASREIVVSDPSDKLMIAKAHEARMALRSIRVNADKQRKLLKEDSLRYGRAVGGAYNMLEHAIVPVETYLKEQEEYAVRMEQARLEELRVSRIQQLVGLDFTPQVDIAYMTCEDFANMVRDAKDLKAIRDERKRKEEEEWIVKERIEREQREAEARKLAEDQERIQLENERLKAEAAEREAEQVKLFAQIAEENRKRDARIAEERRVAAEAAEKAHQERERAEASARKAEAEAKALREADERRKREENERLLAETKAKAEAERRAAQAPDRTRIAGVAKSVRAVQLPAPTSQRGVAIMEEIHDRIKMLADWIDNKAATL